MTLNLAVLVSGSGRSLANLIQQSRAGAIPAQVGLVIASRPGIGGLEIAATARIPHAVVERKSFADTANFSERIFSLCDDHAADLVCLAGWLSLIVIPARYENRVLNIHPSLLPAHGGKGMYGRHVHAAVLASGSAVSGCTVHYVNNQYDSGPILLQRRCPVVAGDTADTLAARVFAEEQLAYPEAIRQFARSHGESVPPHERSSSLRDAPQASEGITIHKIT